MNSSEISVPARILQMVTATGMSAAVGAAASLGVADVLAAGPRRVDDIAGEIDADPPTLYRLLRACTDFGLFDELDDRTFALTELGHGLRTDSPVSMRSFAMWVNDPVDHQSWSGLTTSVRTGRSAFERTNGRNIWDYLDEHQDTARLFDDAMTSVTSRMIGSIVTGYDFGVFRSVVDVGGGRGALLAEILRANPGVHGVLHDQPAVVADVEHSDLTDRLIVEGGSFFDDVPAGSDAYVLSSIIHDWDDEHCERILSVIAKNMAPDGRVLLVEVVMPDREIAPIVKLMDLKMLVLCDGKQRTEPEFAELLLRAGLRLSRVVPCGFYSIVEAVRA